jgi:hypothetical protein
MNGVWLADRFRTSEGKAEEVGTLAEGIGTRELNVIPWTVALNGVWLADRFCTKDLRRRATDSTIVFVGTNC